MKMNLLTFTATALLFATPVAAADKTMTPSEAPVPAGDYTLDKAHASLIFKVNHLGFSNYTARFAAFDATLKFDPKTPAAAKVEASIDPNSLTLENPPKGFTEEIKGDGWLNAKTFPKMTYVSTSVEVTGDKTARITGDLTLHGVTKPVVLEATYNGGWAGLAMDPHARIGFSAHGHFNRSDFGISYGIPAPGTTMGVSDRVDVIIEAEFKGPELKKEKK